MFAAGASAEDMLPDDKDALAPFEDVGPAETTQTAPICVDDICSYTITTYQEIDLGGPGCYDGYRWWNEDVNTYFSDPSFSCRLRSATLCTRFCDADFLDQPASTAELDVVQFGPYAIDIFKGENGQWEQMCWDVRTQILDNNGRSIQFVVNVDATHNSHYWAVTVDYASLKTVWDCRYPLADIEIQAIP
ncbi:MAG: hypothetical protein HKP58_14720 [Desulfatitalea sp.]|nr:hypothetical protein [Desulfatitalea sp.]NNK01660.1 hypothetical protein [Desulfatitalea sp.]